MGRAVAVIVAVLALGLWGFNSHASQQTVGGDRSTVVAQLTAVAGPTVTPTP